MDGDRNQPTRLYQPGWEELSFACQPGTQYSLVHLRVITCTPHYRTPTRRLLLVETMRGTGGWWRKTHLQHGELASPQQKQGGGERNQILEQGFHSPDQIPFEAQHAGQTFPLMETQWPGNKYLVDIVGWPSRVCVVLLDGGRRDTSALPWMQSKCIARQHQLSLPNNIASTTDPLTV